jgi:hypothetical protein
LRGRGLRGWGICSARRCRVVHWQRRRQLSVVRCQWLGSLVLRSVASCHRSGRGISGNRAAALPLPGVLRGFGKFAQRGAARFAGLLGKAVEMNLDYRQKRSAAAQRGESGLTTETRRHGGRGRERRARPKKKEQTRPMDTNRQIVDHWQRPGGSCPADTCNRTELST